MRLRVIPVNPLVRISPTSCKLLRRLASPVHPGRTAEDMYVRERIYIPST